ncbi:MAG: hypothetical protein GY866_02570 [Proteobacteria bacterium]|nr:hypothetical protein [Pseudomonadota bacterium]
MVGIFSPLVIPAKAGIQRSIANFDRDDWLFVLRCASSAFGASIQEETNKPAY